MQRPVESWSTEAQHLIKTLNLVSNLSPSCTSLRYTYKRYLLILCLIRFDGAYPANSRERYAPRQSFYDSDSMLIQEPLLKNCIHIKPKGKIRRQLHSSVKSLLRLLSVSPQPAIQSLQFAQRVNFLSGFPERLKQQCSLWLSSL